MGIKDTLAARSGWLWLCLRETGKSRSSSHLDRIASVVSRTNEPTVRTAASSSSPFAQDWSRGRHFLAAPLATAVFSSPWRPLGRVHFFIQSLSPLWGSGHHYWFLVLPMAPIRPCQVLLESQLTSTSLQGLGRHCLFLVCVSFSWVADC